MTEAQSPLPPEGRSWPELAAALRELKRDDLDWRRGRHAAFVWHADDAVEEVAREAYALFMTENGLGLRVFPSLRRMEADVVAMVRHLLGGDAATAGDTDWSQIVQLYDHLMQIARSPVAALNRAVAVAEVDGAEAGLAIVEGLDLDGFGLFHAIRADLLRRLARTDDAANAYQRAIELTENETEREFLRGRLAHP